MGALDRATVEGVDVVDACHILPVTWLLTHN